MQQKKTFFYKFEGTCNFEVTDARSSVTFGVISDRYSQRKTKLINLKNVMLSKAHESKTSFYNMLSPR